MGRHGELLAHLRHPTRFFPRDARTLARTVVSVIVLAPALIATAALVLVLGVLRAPRRWIDACYTGYAHFAIFVGGTTLTVEGLEHVDPARAYVVIANHESDWDPPVIFAALDHLRMRAVIKREMMQIPVLGAALRASGNVCVDRDETGRDAGRVAAVMDERPRDVSILFYAEGTRSRDGALHAFKKGPFAAAIRYGMPILPVATAGTFHIWPPNTLRIRSAPAAVEIGEPISTAGLVYDDRDALRDRGHAVIQELRARARARLRTRGAEPGGRD